MLNSKYRLSGKIFNPDRIIKTTLFTIKIKNSSEKRFGFVVSKKVSQKAVERNRQKRLFRAAVAKILEKLENMEALIIVNRKSLGERQEKIQQELEKVLLQK